MTELKDITAICPFCEKDMTVKSRELLLAQRYAKANNTPVLVACDSCCRTSQLPDDLKDMTEPELIAYVMKMQDEGDDWLPCVIPIDAVNTYIPGGSKIISGLKFYQPPLGTSLSSPHPDGYLRREYMVAFAFDPGCDEAKKPSPAPFLIGGK